MQHLSNLVSRHPWLWILIFVGATAGVASQARNAEIEPDIKAMLPRDFPAIQEMDAIEELFGGTDFVMVVLESEDILAAPTLERVKELTRKLERVKGIDRVMSLTSANDIRGEDGMMIVERAVKRVPKTAEQREALRAALKDNDLLLGAIVARDFSATAMICQLKLGASDVEVIEGIRAALAEVPGEEQEYIGGAPFLRTEMSEGIGGDMRRLLPLGLGVMLVFLFACFRQLRGVLLPFIVVLMSIGLAMGLVPLLGWKIQLLTVLLPVILIAVANDYGIHILARYQEENTADGPEDTRELVRRIVRALSGPVLVTGITTIAGLLAMLSHVLVPARQVGVLASVGVAWALFGSLVFIPAVLALLPRAKPIAALSAPEDERRGLERLLTWLGRLVTGRPKRVVAVGAGLTVAVGFGALLLTIEMNVINFFPAESALARSTLLLQEKFGGSLNINAVAKGDIKDPAVLRQMDALESRLLELPQVEQVSSIAAVVRRMNETIQGEGESGNRIPDTREEVAQLFLLYSMSGDPSDFDRMVDFPYEHAVLTARIAALSTHELAEVSKTVETFIAENPGTPFSLVGGFSRLLATLVRALVLGQLWSLGLSLLLVTGIVVLLFRSIGAGLASLAPLLSALAALFGLMGLLGVELNHITALLSSIMVGVGVDYTIHFLWRYREERRGGMDPEPAVRHTLATTGRGIVFNALSVIVGFLILLTSGFAPVKWFGFLVTTCIGVSLLGALVLLPALVLVWRPRFLEPSAVPIESTPAP